MPYPICEVCLNSEILCNACKNKLDKGMINETEINISRFLYNLGSKVRGLKEIKLIKAVDVGVLLIVTGPGDAAKVVGKSGAVVKILAKEFKKPIRVVEEAENLRKFVQDMISPVTVMGINTLYTPEGEVYRIRIPTSQRNSLTINPENFSSIIHNLYNRNVQIIFED